VNRAIGPGAVLDAHSCVLLSRVLVPLVRSLPAAELDGLRPALTAIAVAADRERAAESLRMRRDSSMPLTDGWMRTREYAALVGVSEQAVRKRIARGTLAAERRGRAWMVDPTMK
jgi:hypothetical protein